MLDTNKTAWKTAESAEQETSEPGFDWLLVVAAATFLAIVAAFIWNVDQAGDDAVDTDSMVSGFEYSTDATTGKSAAAGVTTEYFGHSDELYPETDLVSGFQYTDETTTGKTVLPGVTIPGLPQRGPIALQHHGGQRDGKWTSPPSLVQFRNIFVRELEP